MKAILHIGTEKTGTTSIQNYLFRNRRRLRGAGLHLLDCAGKYNHRALPAYCLADDDRDDFFSDRGIDTPAERAQFRDAFRNSFRKEMTALPDAQHGVVITSEHFHSRLRTGQSLLALKELLAEHFDSYRIICYLREQAATCVSWYSTSLKYGETAELEAFMTRCTPASYYFNYNALLDNWESVFGRESMQVRLFARQHFSGGDLLRDFSQVAFPQAAPLLKDFQFRDNESLLGEGQALLLAVNRAFGGDRRGGARENLRRACRDLIYKRLNGRGEQPRLSLRQSIFEQFEQSNESVRRRYFDGEVEQLFPPPRERPVAAADSALVEKTVTALLKCVTRKGRAALDGGSVAAVERGLRDSLDAYYRRQAQTDPA